MADVLGDFSPRSDAGSTSLISGISNSNLIGGVSSLFGAGTSLFSGLAQADALNSQAQTFGIAADYANRNAILSGEAGGLKELAAARQIQGVEGKEAATAAGNGLQLAGSAASIVRDASRQGALEEGTIGLQTAIQIQNYQGQAAAYQQEAAAARSAASSATTGGILGAAGGIIGGAAKLLLL